MMPDADAARPRRVPGAAGPPLTLCSHAAPERIKAYRDLIVAVTCLNVVISQFRQGRFSGPSSAPGTSRTRGNANWPHVSYSFVANDIGTLNYAYDRNTGCGPRIGHRHLQCSLATACGGSRRRRGCATPRFRPQCGACSGGQLSCLPQVSLVILLACKCWLVC